MFDNDCQVCAERVLVFPSQITSLSQHRPRHPGHLHLRCGTEQTLVTGTGPGPSGRGSSAA